MKSIFLNINTKVKVDEMKGEYICLRCKGWGYIVEKRELLGKLESFPVALCPDCDGGCIIDWVKRPRQV